MITRRDLVAALARRAPSAWSVVERVQDLALADPARALHRREHHTRFTLIVHHDLPRGRGSARLDLDAASGSALDAVDQALSLALASVGPAWLSTPPAAPAKVDLADPALLARDLDAAALATLRQLRPPGAITLTATAELQREHVAVVASSGFHTRWSATSLRVSALLVHGDHALPVVRHARRTDDLHLDAAVRDAADDLLLLARAAAPEPGPCALWLGPDALLHDADQGLWSIFAHHADSAVERRGLTRHRLHKPIAPGAAQLPEPLSITSDGALDFATRSAPVSDDAVAIRRFLLVDRGIAAGLGLSPREAALRRTDPNGGVRNLVVPPGTWSPAPSTSSLRTLELRRLHAVDLDLDTGEASLDIALALDHRPGRPPLPITGGTVRLELIPALARAHRSSQLVQRGSYRGPDSVLIEPAELIS